MKCFESCRLVNNFSSYICKYFTFPSFFTYVLGARKNLLIETILLSTDNATTYVLVEKYETYFFVTHSQIPTFLHYKSGTTA